MSLSDLVSDLTRPRVMVIGDVILDEYVFGTAARMSREAPVPVLEFTERRVIPGGAANPAVNIATLGARVTQYGIVGKDRAGDELCEALEARGVDVTGMMPDSSRRTTVKQRLMAQMGLRFPQQVARIDFVSREPVSGELAANLIGHVKRDLSAYDAALCSDYHNGGLTPALIGALREQAAVHGTLLTADAQGDFLKYVGFGLVKCNADEAAAFLGRALTTDADFAAAAAELRSVLNLTRAMVITRGADGITFAGKNDRAVNVPSPHVEDVFDTVGAGDTAIAVLTLAAASGMSLEDAAKLANAASGIVVRRVGNYAPAPDELRAALAT